MMVRSLHLAACASVAGLFVASVVSGCSGTDRGGLAAKPAAGTDGGAINDDTFAHDDGGKGSAGCLPNGNNVDVPDNNCDDDGDGEVDNEVSCDESIDVGANAESFAKALGICKRASDDSWGLIEAIYTGSYGTKTPPAQGQWGILPKFGAKIKPREGKRLGVISSGWAREFDDASGTTESFQHGQSMSGAGQAPPGFPKPAQDCPSESTVNDVVTVKLRIKTPANAKGISFDFDFYSGEWPQWVCTRYNDGFAAMLTTKAANGGKAQNISFDSKNNPVSVNNGFFDRCTPGTVTGCAGGGVAKTSTCPGGEDEINGTGFFERGNYCGGGESTGGGATGWLTSKAPVKPNEEITLEFVIWDTGDQSYDSSVLLDHIRWELGETVVGTDRPR